ncbi:uncharacterized protein TRAVEDRAFT_42272 [Trametes versicolor FP-101664 SS1]|uniref:uncharacterized protein n=1 Tax=Trametes versicolor (strain FP-101664) TaxID=717944 RepID=UPI0004622735|nr:uncharacterized protein TRAVEDRAFT_42272 [Trametes versicolor FP-101664 SS1]EIW64860.1 hypothetical protein TRAVEDRAFT_42272 [Trametes versicolor FP-101664 SS1]
MSSGRAIPHECASKTPAWATTDRVADWRATPLRERFEIFNAFMHELEMDGHLKTCVKIAPPHVGAGRRCVKRVPVPLMPPTIFEYPEEDEDDYLEEADSTTACDDGSPVYATPRDKPLPLPPRDVSKKLPPTPRDRNKALPSLPPTPPPKTRRKEEPMPPTKGRSRISCLSAVST